MKKKNKCSYLYIYFCVSLSAGNAVFKLKQEQNLRTFPGVVKFLRTLFYRDLWWLLL